MHVIFQMNNKQCVSFLYLLGLCPGRGGEHSAWSGPSQDHSGPGARPARVVGPPDSEPRASLPCAPRSRACLRASTRTTYERRAACLGLGRRGER